MGFPDNHTKIGAEGKVVPDTSRYKMLGNSVAIPVVEWIALKLTEFMDYSDRIDEVV
jgi:DNA (cytosine-5)-methyltransferase 1